MRQIQAAIREELSAYESARAELQKIRNQERKQITYMKKIARRLDRLVELAEQHISGEERWR